MHGSTARGSRCQKRQPRVPIHAFHRHERRVPAGTVKLLHQRCQLIGSQPASPLPSPLLFPACVCACMCRVHVCALNEWASAHVNVRVRARRESVRRWQHRPGRLVLCQRFQGDGAALSNLPASHLFGSGSPALPAKVGQVQREHSRLAPRWDAMLLARLTPARPALPSGLRPSPPVLSLLSSLL